MPTGLDTGPTANGTVKRLGAHLLSRGRGLGQNKQDGCNNGFRAVLTCCMRPDRKLLINRRQVCEDCREPAGSIRRGRRLAAGSQDDLSDSSEDAYPRAGGVSE